MPPLNVQGAEAQKIIAMLAGGGLGGPPPGAGGPPGIPGVPGAGGPTAGPPGATPSPQAMALRDASNQLDGANPQEIIQLMGDMNDKLAKLYLVGAQRMPAICPHVDKMRQAAAKVMETATKAQQVLGGVAPILNSAGIGPMAGTAQTGGAPDVMALLNAG